MEKKPRKGKENLRVPTSEQAREYGSKGGKASAESRRTKKLMSKIYADFIADRHKIKIENKIRDVSGDELLSYVLKKVLVRGDSSSVQMMKEIREATEGIKGTIDIFAREAAITDAARIFGVAIKEFQEVEDGKKKSRDEQCDI